MFSVIISLLRHGAAKIALTLCGLGICCPCLAELGGFGPKSNNMASMALEFIPISMMSDTDLFAAAEMRRDIRMNNGTRLLNSLWLIQNGRNTYSGGTAVNKFLKVGFKSFWRRRYGSNISTITNEQEEELTYWGKYALDVSEEHILVGVRFKF